MKLKMAGFEHLRKICGRERSNRVSPRVCIFTDIKVTLNFVQISIFRATGNILKCGFLYRIPDKMYFSCIYSCMYEKNIFYIKIAKRLTQYGFFYLTRLTLRSHNFCKKFYIELLFFLFERL